ncbi:MAG: DUF2491 family protein [Alphaproteobacteria bacterium]
MSRPDRRRRPLAILLAAWLAAAPQWAPTAAALAAAASVAGIASDAEARSRSSGGYSRPSVRTPSTSGRSSGFRAPSTSGGYSRPTAPRVQAPRPVAPPSGSDRALQRQSSRDALDQYRRPPIQVPQGPLAPNRTPSTGRSDSYSYGFGGRAPGSRTGPTWSPPDYAQGGPSRFGGLDALMLWYLLDTLNRPGHARFFNDHRDDPGYREWRAEADRRASSDPALRNRLDELDRQVASVGEPPQPGRLPPDLAQEESGGGIFGVLLTIALIAAFAWITWRFFRRRRAAAAKGGNVGPIDTATGMLRRKLEGTPYRPSLFRVGMTFPIDRTPFLLSGGATKVPPPPIEGDNALASVAAVGRIKAGEVEMTRLYLAGSEGWFQLFLGASGAAEECRWFAPIDEVSPADADEWGFWLDPAEGMIGWPEFQTKDGKVYGRHWLPGDARVDPRQWTETIEGPQGARTRTVRAMLYSAPTGAAAPAPDTEYVVVSAFEEGGEAFVEGAAGFGGIPAALALA